jgi:non-ribosomal peptide synthetase component F
MHHIVSDGWSMGVLIKEVAALYEAFAQGATASPLAELTVQYGDFAHWQREWLQGEVLERQLSYWRRQLGGTLPVLKLPFDRPRPNVPAFRGRRDTYPLPSHLSEALKTLSQQQNATLFMTLLAAFQILLSRHSGQEDILIGSAIANRNRGETEDLIGFFVNMLVMRGNLAGDPTFLELLKQVRETALGAYAHQDVPFEKLVEEFVQERQRNHAPLVQVAFGLHNAPMQTLELPNLTLQLLDFEEDAGRFDLTLWINDEAGELNGTWYYNTDLFDAETIKRFHGHFETLLASIAAQPQANLSAIEMYTEEEKRQLEAKKKEGAETRLKKLRNIKRQVVSESALTLPPPHMEEAAQASGSSGD